MVRISGGTLRGRRLRVPRAGVRPTKDMVRQALFSAIGPSIEGKRVADLFAGSGAIGIEAVSRGAAEVWWVEADGRTYEVLTGNVAGLAGEEAARRCMRLDVVRWLASALAPAGLDLVVADPPYRSEADGVGAARLLEALGAGTVLKPEGLFVMEQHADEPVVEAEGWSLIKQAAYGETRLVYYRRG
jgi:16S rRNA (guanine966-N2)-methyltransferase